MLLFEENLKLTNNYKTNACVLKIVVSLRETFFDEWSVLVKGGRQFCQHLISFERKLQVNMLLKSLKTHVQNIRGVYKPKW